MHQFYCLGKASKENDDICISLSFELEQNRNNDRDEIFKDTENKNENEVRPNCSTNTVI